MKKYCKTFSYAQIIIVALCLVASSEALAARIYVDRDANGANDGSSWADACNYLQDALATASSGDEIWVAAGIYKPDRGVGITPGDRSATFQLKNGVALKGGYAGFGQPNPDARDIYTYETILSGDLNGDDVRGLGDPSRNDNSYHVVTSSGNNNKTVLDGFAVTGGNANHSAWPAPGRDPDNYGGGMYNEKLNGYGGDPTITRCTFRRNSASESGGGFYNYYGHNPTLTNCTFSNNLAYSGGGMYDAGGQATLTGCTFSQNRALSRGGGLNTGGAYSASWISNCIFIGNSGAAYGGGLYHSGIQNSLMLTNCYFSGNQASRSGGGMYMTDYSDSTLTNCTFSANSADYEAGGICTFVIDSLTLTNCILWGNVDGGGTDESSQIEVSNLSGIVVNYNCIQGWTGSFGGTGNTGQAPLFIDSDGTDNLIGTEDDNSRLLSGSPCIDAGDNAALPPDTADLDGDGDTTEPTPLDLDGNERFLDDPETTDSGSGSPPIVDMGAYEGPNQGLLLSVESLTVPEGQIATFSVALAMNPLGTIQLTIAQKSGDSDITVQSGATLIFDSTNYSNPQAVTLAAAEDGDNINGTALIWISGPEFLTAGVTAIEGDNEFVANVLYVDDSATGLNRGSSWSEAYTQLQDALYVAATNPNVEEIRVAQGIYKPDRGTGITTGDRTATFKLKKHMVIKGGYAGLDAPNPDARDIHAYETILSGDLADNDVPVADPRDLPTEPTRVENSYHVVDGSGTDETAILDGFAITSGNANESEPHNRGGGMYNDSGRPTVTNCTFSANSAEDGGGMCNYESHPAVANCIFIGNAADNGGGMWGFNSSPSVSDCTFSGNHTSGSGAGMYCSGSGRVSGCTFSNNYASAQGGGMRIDGPAYNLEVIDCLFLENQAYWGGGMENWSGSRAKVINCIFTRNEARDKGGGIHHYESLAGITGCTFYQNQANSGGGMYYYSQNVLMAEIVRYCIFVGNKAQDSGGALYNWVGEGGMNLCNCIFIGNSAGDKGGAMVSWWYSHPHFTNCTFSSNTASTCGGIVNLEGCTSTLINCIVWGNSDAGGADESAQIYTTGREFFVSYSCIQDWTGTWGGTGNIGDGPKFVREPDNGGDGWGDDPATPAVDEGANDDYGNIRIMSGSPCIDAGDNSAPLLAAGYIPIDMDGNSRLFDDPDTPDTGYGMPPIVDMGAYEFIADGGTTYHPADTDSDYVIDDFELLDYIDLWADGQVEDFDLLDAIDLWAAGHY